MRLFPAHRRDFSLRARVTGVMLVLFGMTAILNYWLTSRIERAALAEVQSHVQTLSKAIQISVQQLPAGSAHTTATNVLRDYQSRLRSSGVEEITILDAERRVIASSRRPEPSNRGVFRPALATTEEKTRYDLTIPVVAADHLLGYVSLHLLLDNFAVLFRNMAFYKTLGSVGVFGLGMLLMFGLVSYLTRPLEDLKQATGEVAGGNLDVRIPDPPSPELQALVAAFRSMSARLKEQQMLERRLREQEKSAALGQMAAGIAHDVRNPLNFIGLTFEHLSSKSLLDDPASRELLNQAHCELMRVSTMIQDFLDFGREIKPRLKPESVARILAESREEVARRQYSQEAAIEVLVPEENLQAVVDPDLLRRSLVNLLQNAVEASGPDGRVRAGVTSSAQPGEVVIWVEDTGPGIEPESIDRIFNPYFTTKSSGVGLGLALVKKWVHDIDGRIRVFSQPGRGSRFELSFPAAAVTRAGDRSDEQQS
ncbi:MAG: ATP-binding protein [Acidobacteriota bacterium]